MPNRKDSLSRYAIDLDHIIEWQRLLMPALAAYPGGEAALSAATGVPRTSLIEYKRGPMSGMSFIAVVKLFGELGIEPNKVAQVLGLWQSEQEQKELNTEVYVIMSALARKEPDRQKMILWVIQALLKEEE